MKPLPKIHLFILLCAAVLCGCGGKEVAVNHETLTRKADALLEAEAFADAVVLLRSVEAPPEQAFEIADRLAAAHAGLGEHEAAMEVWRAGHARGEFFLISSRLPQYAPFADLEGFAEIEAEDARLRAAALETSRTLHEVVLPHGAGQDGRSYPLLMVFHGGGSTMARARAAWMCDRLERDYIVVFVQSYLHYNCRTFGWRGLDPRAREEIAAIFDAVTAAHPVDPERVFVGGVSAGGIMAGDLLFNDVIPARGLLGVCTGQPTEFDADRVAAVAAGGKRVFLVGGETDFMRERQDLMVAAFAEAGLDFRRETVPGLGHGYPADFPSRIERGLAFLEAR